MAPLEVPYGICNFRSNHLVPLMCSNKISREDLVKHLKGPGEAITTIAYGQKPPVPDGRPLQTSAAVTNPSAITVDATFVLSTDTGTSRTEGIFAPEAAPLPVGIVVTTPAVNVLVSVPVLIAATSFAVPSASRSIFL